MGRTHITVASSLVNQLTWHRRSAPKGACFYSKRDCRAAPPCGGTLWLAVFGQSPLTEAGPDYAAYVDDQEH